jgi:molybdopterin adenylyltransferase
LQSNNIDRSNGLRIAVLTVSDTRDIKSDLSGKCLLDKLQMSGHTLTARAIVQDDIYQLRSVVSQWIASEQVQVILLTGGTGFSNRDNTPQAVIPLFDKEILGFGELFRSLSYTEIGTATIQSRATAGYANNTAIFCLPGSPKACRTAWDKIIEAQLESSNAPCNLVPRLMDKKEAAVVYINCH